ncbi:MAG: winged helix-turn-helix domain-containing protein, partial [Flavobacterium sp.]
MDSPVQIPFKSFIQLKPEDATALYLQIVFEFIKAIQTGLLPEGTKLPGTRILCKLLAVNRNTLIKAFQDLELQGWIEILPNKGTFILSEKKEKKKTDYTSTEKN